VREIRYDPDVWIVEVEDRAGRNFLDDACLKPEFKAARRLRPMSLPRNVAFKLF